MTRVRTNPEVEQRAEHGKALDQAIAIFEEPVSQWDPTRARGLNAGQPGKKSFGKGQQPNWGG